MKACVWMKRISALMLAVMLCVTLCAPAFAAGAYTTLAKKGSAYYVTARSGLNFRKGPGTNYAVQRVLSRGTKVTFQSEKSGWWLVKLSNGKTGYVDKRYLTTPNVKSTGTYRTKARLNVRKEPSTRTAVLGVLKNGAKVNVVELYGDWCRITAGGRSGWVASKYLK